MPLGLPEERIRRLELVALLHDVGMISFSDPDAAASEPTEVVSGRSQGILSETGYLSLHARILAGALGVT